MKNCLFVFSFLLLLLGNLGAQNAQPAIYVLYSNQCMDYLEYRTAYSNNNTAYVAYALRNGSDRHTLFTGTGIAADNLPKGTLDCRSLQLTDEMMNAVNRFSRQLFIVQQQQRGYMVVPVTSITKTARSGSFYLVTAPNYSFIFDTTNLTINTNLASAGSQAAVSLTTFGVHNCRYQYAFRRTAYEQGKEQAEFDFISGIGIVNERSGRNATEMMSNQTSLWGVNGYALEDYINRGCGGSAPPTSIVVPPPAPSVGTTAYDPRLGDPATGTVTQPGVTYPVSVISGQPAVNCPKQASPGYHIVQPKENVNSIARFYGVTAAQIVSWNKLKSADKISVCQELRVSPPGSTPVSPVGPYTGNNLVPQQAKSPQTAAPRTLTLPPAQPAQPPVYQPVQSASPTDLPDLFNGGGSPITYSTPQPTYQPLAQPPYSAPATYSVPTTTPNGQYYAVQPLEGVYTISQKFGYTEQRLRAINGFPATGDIKLKVGQLLKVSDCDAPAITPGTGAVIPKAPVGTATPLAPIVYNTQPTGTTSGFVPLSQTGAPVLTQPVTQPAPAPNNGFIPLGGGATPTMAPVNTQPVAPSGPTKQPLGYQDYFVKDSETIRDIVRKKKIGISAEELALINSRDVNEVLPPGTKIQIPIY